MVVGYGTKLNRTKINQTKYNQTKINRGRNPTNCSIRSRDIGINTGPTDLANVSDIKPYSCKMPLY